jgi:tight adherence protein C
MVTVIATGLFLCFAAALFFLGAAMLSPSSVVAVRLRSLLAPEKEVRQKAPIQERIENALTPISRAVPKSPAEVSRVRGLLMQAGYRESYHATIYFALKLLLPVLGFAIAVGSGLAARSPIFAVAFPLFGFVLPGFALKRMIRRRQMLIRLGLPDALDLTTICVEAGLGLDQSLKRVGEEISHAHPELSNEFALLDLEVRAGKMRPEALRNLASRTGVDDVRALVAVLVQTDRFGTSIAQALRVHADSLRTQRRQRAEEQAAKTTIKMVPVLVFFLFPAMFLVSLGPAAINAVRNILPMLQH